MSDAWIADATLGVLLALGAFDDLDVIADVGAGVTKEMTPLFGFEERKIMIEDVSR